MREVHIIQYHRREDEWNVASVYRVWSMMLVRVNLRVALGALCLAALLLMLYWSRCGELAPRPLGSVPRAGGEPGDYIECVINGEYSVGCRRDLRQDEVYVPFSLVHKYFEIYGKIASVDGVEQFQWLHSYGKVYHPKKKYDPRGTFTTFENYNVEVRDRVKCISGVEGVPVSTQWEPRGFFYPTQIAQFGLAHYSKNLTEPEPRRRVLEDGEAHRGGWLASADASMAREPDQAARSRVLRFSTSDRPASQVWLQLDLELDFVLSVDLQLAPNSSLTVVLQHKDSRKEAVYLHYVTNTRLIYVQEDHVYHGIGSEPQWRRVTRDLIIDMQKGWALQERPKRRAPRNKFKISMLMVRGAGALDNVTVSSSEHMAQFYAAARWLVRNQRADSGGWPIPVRRRIAAGVAELEPGWHSAMSQGHAMSLLSRAYHRSGERAYLLAARRALRLLDVPAPAGVRATWMDKYAWYEEYPTTPPLFVLNGFIYTLLGLYDVAAAEGGAGAGAAAAARLFAAGMASLKALLPLFDSGSGSFYDLRHFTLAVSPNVARWDYHATHVNQLYLLAGLDAEPALAAAARRWEGYMRGRRAPHN